MGNADRIPDEVIEKEVRRQIRLIASMVISAMAEADMKPEDLDARLGWSEGTTGRRLVSWMRGTVTSDMAGLGLVVGLAMAMGHRLVFSITSLEDLYPLHRVHPAPEG